VHCVFPCFREARGRRFDLRVASLLAQHRVHTVPSFPAKLFLAASQARAVFDDST
jgi:hypothetical protein